MRTRLFILPLALILTLVPLSGCGSGSAGGTGAKGTSSLGSGSEGACENTYSGVSNLESEKIEAVCALTNTERLDTGASELVLDPELTAIAQAHARDMVERSYFSHTNPDGESPFDRLREAGVTYQAAAENIAWGQSTPSSVMTAWMNSSGHRTNLLNTRYRKIGVGSYQNHWVQIFTN